MRLGRVECFSLLAVLAVLVAVGVGAAGIGDEPYPAAVGIQSAGRDRDIVIREGIAAIYQNEVAHHDLPGNSPAERFEQAKNEMVASNRGYLRDFGIAARGPGIDTVTATVVRNANILADQPATANLVRLIGNPKLAVCITEIRDGEWNYFPVSTSIIAGELADYGFYVVRQIEMPPHLELVPDSNLVRLSSSSQISAGSSYATTGTAVGNSQTQISVSREEYLITNWFVENFIRGNREEVVEFARRNNIDYLVVGTSRSTYAGGGAGRRGSEDRHPTETCLDLNVLNIATGEVIGTFNQRIVKSQPTVLAAAEQGNRELSAKAAREFAGRMVRALSLYRHLRVVIRNLSFDGWGVVEAALKGNPDVQFADMKKYTPEESVVEVRTTRSAAQLAGFLTGQVRNLTVTAIAGNQIEMGSR